MGVADVISTSLSASRDDHLMMSMVWRRIRSKSGKASRSSWRCTTL